MRVLFRGRSKNAKVKVKFFSGIHHDLGIENYDLGEGITADITEGETIGSVMKRLGLPDRSGCAYFINRERGGLGSRLKEGDEISCFRPAAGG